MAAAREIAPPAPFFSASRRFILLVSGKKSLGSHLPFGTFLAIGVVIAFLYGNSLWHWYISFLTFG
jgi:prepilin signal peptidase PulO-like enzyme (type II secretory pathway)